MPHPAASLGARVLRNDCAYPSSSSTLSLRSKANPPPLVLFLPFFFPTLRPLPPPHTLVFPPCPSAELPQCIHWSVSARSRGESGAGPCCSQRRALWWRRTAKNERLTSDRADQRRSAALETPVTSYRQSVLDWEEQWGFIGQSLSSSVHR